MKTNPEESAHMSKHESAKDSAQNITQNSADEMQTAAKQSEPPVRKTLWGALSFILMPLFLLFSLFFYQLFHGSGETLPSSLLGRKTPDFSLAALEPDQKQDGTPQDGHLFTSAALREGHVSLLTVFASWCAPCHEEHPLLMALAHAPPFADGTFRLVGLGYKDTRENLAHFLRTGGNPFSSIGLDADGRVGLDFGVYGVPEHFVIAADGTITARLIGPLTPESLRTSLLPALQKAQLKR